MGCKSFLRARFAYFLHREASEPSGAAAVSVSVCVPVMCHVSKDLTTHSAVTHTTVDSEIGMTVCNVPLDMPRVCVCTCV